MPRQWEGNVRIPSGCAISGIIATDGAMLDGEKIIESIAVMHERSNGLGGGFAGYGIYPQYKDLYALHIFYENQKSREACEAFMDRHYDIVNLSRIPVRPMKEITGEPLIWRYFLRPLPTRLAASQLDENEFIVRSVMRVNSEISGAYVFFLRQEHGRIQGLRLSGGRGPLLPS